MVPRIARPWSPLLAGSAAERADRFIEAIARSFSSDPPTYDSERRYPYSLGFGDAGIATFFGYLALTKNEEGCGERALAFLNSSLGAMESEAMGPDFFRGVAGIGWVLARLSGSVWEDSAAFDDCDAVDQLLNDAVENGDPPGELLGGLAGVALYAVERAKCPSGDQLLQAVIHRLSSSAITVERGIAWSPTPHMISLIVAEAGRFDDLGLKRFLETSNVLMPGVAHGAAGVVGALSTIAATQFHSEHVTPLIEKAVSWILSCRRSRDSVSEFAIYDGFARNQFQSGWCNGDLGIAITLVNAGNVVGRPDWVAAGVEVALAEGEKTVNLIEAFNQRNLSLCHGHAGRAHLFNRLFHLTGELRFADIARYWCEAVFSMMDQSAEPLGNEPRGLLAGRAGVGLALTAAISHVEPCWDRALVCS